MMLRKSNGFLRERPGQHLEVMLPAAEAPAGGEAEKAAE